MKLRFALLIPLLGLAALTPRCACAQGTINPANVSLRELVHQPTDDARPQFVRIDASGNIFLGSVARTVSVIGDTYYLRSSSVIGKYNPQGTLLWSRSRNLTSVTDQQNPPTTTYYESWGDGPNHQISQQKYNVDNVALSGWPLIPMAALRSPTTRIATMLFSGRPSIITSRFS